MRAYFDILRKNDILSRKGIRVSTIESLSRTQIIDLATELKTATEAPTRTPSKHTFTHSTSAHLSGGRDLCDSLDCRLSRLDELARFSLLYSDQVYIHNFFADYEHSKEDNGQQNEPELKQHFYQDVFLTVRYKPLFERGYIIPFNPPTHICESCLANSFLGRDADKKLGKGYKWLAKDMFSNTSLHFEIRDNHYCVLRCAGSNRYFDHVELSPMFEEVPEPLASMAKLMARAKRGESVPLGQALRKRLGIHYELADIAVNNISYEIAKAQSLNTTILTSKSFFPPFLGAMSDNPDIERRNSIAMRYLTSIVPFVEDVEISELIKLRERENLSFTAYRAALNNAIDEFKSSRAMFNERDARALYADVIAPRLSSLEHRVKDARRHLRVQPIRTTIALAGVIAFGLYTGFIPTEMVEIAKLLGLGKIAMDIQKEVMALKDAERDVRNEDLYFLWKVQRKAKRSSRRQRDA